MNFLLLLSAMLSAFTGVVTVGGAVAPQALSRGLVESAAVQVRDRAVTKRPQQAVRSLIDSAAMPLASPLALVTIEPLFASRLRE